VDCGGITDGSLDARFQFVSLAPAPTKSAAMKTRIVSKVGIDPFMFFTRESKGKMISFGGILPQEGILPWQKRNGLMT